MVSYASLTQYSKIFQDTYWGNFTTHNPANVSNDILWNRDLFVANYNIKNNIKKLQKFSKHIIGQCDHLEYYSTYDKKQILICSPYSNFDSFSKQPFLENGWIEIPPMYNTNATTFMKEI